MRKVKQEGGWEVHEILDPNQVKRITKYFYKRKRAPRIELEDKISQQLAGYTLIEKDLRNVIAWLYEIDQLHLKERRNMPQISLDRKTYNIVKGLYVAALTFYGKCFTTCEGRKIKLEKKLLKEKYWKRHDEIMHMRHNFAAHSGADSFEEVKIALVLYPNKRSNEKPKLYRELMQPDFLDNPDCPFSEVVNDLRTAVLNKIRQIEDKIYEQEIAPKGKEYWYKKTTK
ncbi:MULTISPECIES: hypothetical protein [Aeromonas]|uniref:hypothetical protein n=1 Tax=Aeromonas TaxID=642 RepID=UPI002B48667B|nr:hypothetical protein [Aeromonas veronii]